MCISILRVIFASEITLNILMSNFNLHNEINGIPERETFLTLEGNANDLYKDEDNYKSITLVDVEDTGDEVLSITVDSLNEKKKFPRFDKLLDKKIKITIEILNR